MNNGFEPMSTLSRPYTGEDDGSCKVDKSNMAAILVKNGLALLQWESVHFSRRLTEGEFRVHTYAGSIWIMACFWWGTDLLAMRKSGLRRSLTGSSRTPGERTGITVSAEEVPMLATSAA